MKNRFGNEYVQVTPNLYLTEYSFNLLDSILSSPVKKRECVNHIWIYDRSGSMYGLLDNLIEDLIKRAKTIPVGDTITFGWFSSEGQKNFIIKGFKITEAKDYAIMEKSLRANNTTIGCTCFSEILAETEQVIQDLSVFSSNFALCFFTDGFPVVSNYTKEIKDIFDAVEKLNDKVTSALLVGYGDYYNKQLMSDMAEKIGGSLTHSANLPSFSISLDSFVNNSQENKKIAIKLDSEVSKDALVFNINGENINLYAIDANKEVKISCAEEEKATVYVLTNTKPKGVHINLKDNQDNPFIKVLYAAAYILTQKTKTDVAIDVLGYLGDKKLVDLVTNSYTNAEYGKAEQTIKDAIVEPAKRWLEGRVENYVAPADAFCLLDLIDLLSNDKDAYFYPRHDAFSYKRIGKPSKPDESYPEFKADKETRSSFKDIVWNENKLNLSLRTIIRGDVDLGSEAKKYGLTTPFPTYQYRNYTFVKDGILNVTKAPACMSEPTFKKLKEKKVVSGNWNKDEVYVLNLEAVPIVNRRIADGKTSAIALCRLVLLEQKAKAQIKVYKWFKQRDFPEKEITAETARTFIEKQQAFLESKGINTRTGVFEPPVTESEATDFYMAKEFTIKIKGLSSLPKVEAVTAKLKENKKLTTSEDLLIDAINVYSNNVFDADKDKLGFLEKALDFNSTILKGTRREIQETKFAVLLCKKWFDELPSREDNKLTVDNYEFTLSVTEKKVPF